MNQYYNKSVPSPHLFRSSPSRISYPQTYPASNTPPGYTAISRRPPGYSSPTPNTSTYPSPYSNYPLYSNASPYSNTSPNPHPMLYPYHAQAFPSSSAYSNTETNFNSPAYSNSTSYPMYPSSTSLSPIPQFTSASYGITAWPASGTMPQLSGKGLETILIAILILAALDLILVRPHKENLLQRGE